MLSKGDICYKICSKADSGQDKRNETKQQPVKSHAFPMKWHIHPLFSTSGFNYFHDKVALKRKYPGYTFPCKLTVKHKLIKAMP